LDAGLSEQDLLDLEKDKEHVKRELDDFNQKELQKGYDEIKEDITKIKNDEAFIKYTPGEEDKNGTLKLK
jgi:hypothetical protein